MTSESAIAKLRAEIKKMGDMNAKVGYVRPSHLDSDHTPFSEENTTQSPGSAWMANQMGRKEIIGSSVTYLGPDAPGTMHHAHLQRFLSGAHAFITPALHYKIYGEWNLVPEKDRSWAADRFKGWGVIRDDGTTDFNFVAPLDDADAMVQSACTPDGGGLFQLEQTLGIPCGDWVNQCTLPASESHKHGGAMFGIYRYTVVAPRDNRRFNLRVPSGAEMGAYGSWWDKSGKFTYGEWQPGGDDERRRHRGRHRRDTERRAARARARVSD